MQVLTGHSTSDLYFTFNSDMDMGVWSAPGTVPTRALQKAMENLRLRAQGHSGKQRLSTHPTVPIWQIEEQLEPYSQAPPQSYTLNLLFLVS